MRALVTLSLLLATSPALAWVAPESLVAVREDLRSAVAGDDPALRMRLEGVWKQAEAEQDLALRHAVVRSAVNGSSQVLDHATDRLLEWAKTERGRLLELLQDPELIAGPRGEPTRCARRSSWPPTTGASSSPASAAS